MNPRRGARCKVCNSRNLDYYETLYYKARGKVTYPKLAELAREKGEDISRKSFERHFKNHYTPDRIQQMLDKGVIDENVRRKRDEAINILDEITSNLRGLKALIDSAKHSKNLSDIVAVYREHRLTLQDIEKLRDKLSTTSSLTQAEMYKIIYWAAEELCPDCRKKFWVKLDEQLRKHGCE